MEKEKAVGKETAKFPSNYIKKNLIAIKHFTGNPSLEQVIRAGNKAPTCILP